MTIVDFDIDIAAATTTQALRAVLIRALAWLADDTQWSDGLGPTRRAASTKVIDRLVAQAFNRLCQ